MTACRLTPGLRKLMSKVANCQDRMTRGMGKEQHEGTTYFMGYAPGDSCKDYNIKLMRGAGANYLGSGAFRSAYSYRDGKQKCVVRLAHAKDARKHNLQEAKAWKHAGPLSRKLLLPVTEYDPEGVWSVSPKALVKELPESTRAQIGAEVEGELSSIGLYASDLHTGNVGRYEGRPVAIDYGFGVENAFDPEAYKWRPEGGGSGKKPGGAFDDDYMRDWVPPASKRGGGYQPGMRYKKK